MSQIIIFGFRVAGNVRIELIFAKFRESVQIAKLRHANVKTMCILKPHGLIIIAFLTLY